MSLLAEIVAFLSERGVAYALIGGSAMALHGAARSTQDMDFLVVERDLLVERWWRGFPVGCSREVRPGDLSDPLAGVVRLWRDEENIDLVIGRGGWESDLLARAAESEYQGVRLPVVDRVGLIQLKLYAGGPQDMWDVHTLLADVEEAELAAVDAAVAEMPAKVQSRWEKLRGELAATAR